MKHIYDNTPSEDYFADRLREVAQSYEPPFEPADWVAMQQRLTQHNRKTVYKRLVVWVSASAAALVAILWASHHIINTYLPVQEHQLTQQNLKTEASFPNKRSHANRSSQKETTSTIAPSKAESFVAKKTDKSMSSEASRVFGSPTNAQNNLAYSSPVTNFDSETMTSKENNFATVTTQKEETTLHGLGRVDVSQAKSAIFWADLQTKNIQQNIEQVGTVRSNDDIPPLQLNPSNAPSVVLGEVERTTAVASAEGRWRMGAALKAMVNFYRSDDQLRINYGNGYGILLDRQMNNNFTVSAGAIYSERYILIKELPQLPNFAALDENETIWIQKNTTRVNWKLIDLPLSMRYNAIQTQRNKWFLSTGISNYFFIRENYESDYIVSTPDIFDPRVTRTQAVTRQRETEAIVQPLATLNVSFGVETSLGKRLTLQVEPYWNFPIRSLGSEGVFVQTGGLLTRINFAR